MRKPVPVAAALAARWLHGQIATECRIQNWCIVAPVAAQGVRKSKGKEMTQQEKWPWTPEVFDAWAEMQLNEATDQMFAKGIKITPESFSKYFEEEYGLSWSPREAEDWLERQDWYGKEERLKQSLEAFLASEDFYDGMVAATRASWSGSGYVVELFEDGRWSVLWDNSIGNKYNSPGVILGMPTLDDSDLQEYLDKNGVEGEDGYWELVYSNDEDDLKNELRERFAQ